MTCGLLTFLKRLMLNSVENLIAYCRENSRICPMPQHWNAIYKLLPNRQRVGGHWEPALPLILAAWQDTPAIIKMLRLEEHIRWAAEHNALDSVAILILGLEESHWHHLGD
jgi:hypothetical protein